MKIHYLQHVPFEDPASIKDWICKNNLRASCTRFYAGDPLPQIDDFDWLIVMGGPMNVYQEDLYPWLTEEKRLIERAIAHGKTIIGICLGGQLIADVLGARVFRNAHKEIGWFPIELTREALTSPLFDSFPQRMIAFHWHGDAFELPSGAMRLASSEACPNQAFIHDARVIALQFHLESTPQSIRALIENCADEIVADAFVQTPEQMLAQSAACATINAALHRLLDRLRALPPSANPVRH